MKLYLCMKTIISKERSIKDEKMVQLIFIFILIFSIFCVSFIIFIRFNCIVVTIDQSSMYPALVPGDRILALRHWPANWLRKGKIVLLKMEHLQPILAGPNSSLSTLYVKRIVGVAGETLVTTRESEEVISHNEQLLLNSEQRMWHIPASFIFVRGDNRVNSLDSHYWGPVPLKCVQGIMLMRLRRTPSTNSTYTFLHAASQTLMVGEDAPIFEAPTLNGEIVNLQAYSKQSLLLIFFMPSHILTEHFFQYDLYVPEIPKTGTLTALVSGSSAEHTRRFLDKFRIDLPVLIAPVSTNSMFQDYKVTTFPYYCYIDTHGNVIATGHINVKEKEEPSLYTS
jgi:signal peptidase I